MAKIILYGGCVGDFDGAYDWARPGDESKPGWHKASNWPGDEYLVIDIPDELIAPYPKERT